MSVIENIEELARPEVFAELNKWNIDYESRTSTKRLVSLYNRNILPLKGDDKAIKKMLKAGTKKSPARARKATPPRKSTKSAPASVPEWIKDLSDSELTKRVKVHGINSGVSAATRVVIEKKYAKKLAELAAEESAEPTPVKVVPKKRTKSSAPILSDDDEDGVVEIPKKTKAKTPKRASAKTPKRTAAAPDKPKSSTKVKQTKAAVPDKIFSDDEGDVAFVPTKVQEKPTVETVDDTGALICQIVAFLIVVMSVVWMANEYGLRN